MSRELEARIVLCKHWRWMPGMRSLAHPYMLDGREFIAPMRRWTEGDGTPKDGRLPDLDDAATLGCIELELLPSAWADPYFSIIADGDGTWRCVGSLDYRGLYGFSSRKAAAVYALEAAP